MQKMLKNDQNSHIGLFWLINSSKQPIEGLFDTKEPPKCTRQAILMGQSLFEVYVGMSSEWNCQNGPKMAILGIFLHFFAYLILIKINDTKEW